MAQTISTGSNRLAKKRQYRRAMWGSLFGGIVIALVLRVLGYPLVSEAVYWVGIIGFLGIWQGTSLTLFDERDVTIERRASQLALAISAVVLVVGASAVRVLSVVGEYTVSPTVSGFLYGYMAVFVTFAIAFVWVHARA